MTDQPTQPDTPEETDVTITEPAAPELVEQPEPGTAVERTPEEGPASAAITAAANAAMNNPGAPGAAEFMALAAQARIISLSGAAPKAIRENPYIAFHVALIGRDFGLSVAAAAELVDIIDTGKGPRISLSPQLLNGQIRRLSLGSIIPIQRTPAHCVAAALAPNGEYDERCKASYPDHADACRCRGVLGTSTFTWEDAQMAGLAGLECQPGEHKMVTKQRQNGTSYQTCGCNQGYVTYPARMLWWRAGGFAGDDYFPEASLGLYSPEALGAPVDDEGRPIDPSTVALPPGYEPAPDPKEERRAQREAEEQVPAAPLELLDLQIRVAALPEEQRLQLRERWKEHDVLKLYRLDNLPQKRLRLAAAMVQGFESQARTSTRGTDHEWNESTARAVVVSALTALAPQDGPEEDGGTTAPADPPEAGSGPEGAQPDPLEEEDGSAEDAPPRHPQDDPALAEAKERVNRLVEAAPQELVDRIVAEVKAMHHTRVDAIVREHGDEPAGHIDVRRMQACGYLIADEMEPQDGASEDVTG